MAFNILKKAGYSENIARKAEIIYQSLNQEYLGSREIRVLFCAYNAYLSLDMISDVRLIAGRLSIPKNKISRVFTECSPIKTGYNFRQIRFTMQQYVLLYLNNLECIDYKQKEIIFKIAQYINIYDYEALINQKQQALAIALIIYYLVTIKELEKVTIFEKILYRPEKTIRGLKGLSKKFNLLNYCWIEEMNGQKMFDLSILRTSSVVNTPED